MPEGKAKRTGPVFILDAMKDVDSLTHEEILRLIVGAANTNSIDPAESIRKAVTLRRDVAGWPRRPRRPVDAATAASVQRAAAPSTERRRVKIVRIEGGSAKHVEILERQRKWEAHKRAVDESDRYVARAIAQREYRFPVTEEDAEELLREERCARGVYGREKMIAARRKRTAAEARAAVVAETAAAQERLTKREGALVLSWGDAFEIVRGKRGEPAQVDAFRKLCERTHKGKSKTEPRLGPIWANRRSVGRRKMLPRREDCDDAARDLTRGAK